ncbi:dual specificity calcium/calmodulin-dependent 3',5'-cyclic nucleotide phosphodiesterase 1A-like isoform X5 [Bolinopsis microptera]|uniref:dual specificity calcium/calmodulin-dependent 3',5'-cyclic nucleotide phosphodiesterase 1A-like isoform X5 n=1 Tax=Bolinopsis microptera TaxID=2820187 RepID=UPI00307ADC08
MPSSKRNNAVSKAQRELYTRILDSDFLVFQIDGLVVLKVNNAPKCQNNENESPEDKIKPDPLDPKNIADSIIRLEELKKASLSKTKHDSDEVLEQALSILRHTESIISSIRRASVGMVSEDIEAQTMISSVEDTPKAVKEWLAATFTKQIFGRRQAVEPPKFRSIVQAVRASMYVDKITRKTSQAPVDVSPATLMLQDQLNNWDIDVFKYDGLTGNKPFRGLFGEVLRRYGLVKRFKINLHNLENYCALVENGYNLHGNPYHNAIHGADVLITTHNLISSTGFASWMTDIEILALLFSAMIHDVEHTGTTNNFHICTSSPLTIMYNDRSVLENHHISSAYRYLDQPDSNPFDKLSKDDFREMRGIAVEAVLGTDMSAHFTQIKNMQNALFNPSTVNRNTAMTLILHCADISHPTKTWGLHKKWTDNLMEEFFCQGDKETSLGLPNSPLCNRTETLVPESQVGFIDFIIVPSMNLLGDMFDALLLLQNEEANATGTKSVNYKKVDRPWDNRLSENRKRWKELVTPKDETPVTPAVNGRVKEEETESVKEKVSHPPTKKNSTTDQPSSRKSSSQRNSQTDAPSSLNGGPKILEEDPKTVSSPTATGQSAAVVGACP